MYKLSMFVFNISNKKLPECVAEMFTKNKDIHSHTTLQANKLHVPFARITCLRNTVRFLGVKTWNLINDNIDSNCYFNI